MAAGMAKLLGFGILFGAKDDGATRTAEEVRESVEGVNEAAVRTGREGSQGLQRLGNAISALNLAQLGRISSQLGSIAERAGAMSDVSSTSLESWGAQASLTYRQVTAGMGEFSGEMDAMRGEMMGVAHALQMDVGQIARLGRAVVTAGTSFEEIGLSVRGAAGAIQAGIIDAEGFGNTIREMTHHLDMSGDEVGNFMNDLVVLGEQVGEGQSLIRQVPQMVQGIRQATAEFPALREHSSELMMSLARLARGMHEISGVPMEETLSRSLNVFEQLVGSRRGLRDLFSGLSSDFPNLATEIGIASGDIGGSLNAMLQDPATFAVRVAEIFNREGVAGTQMGDRLTSVLAGMGGPFLRLIEDSDEARAALAAMSQELGDTSGSLERMSTSASGSTRTFAESMDLLRERFQHQLNTMVRSIPGYQNFEQRVLRRQGEAYDRLAGRIENLSRRGGPIGSLTNIMLALRRGGVGGLALAVETELGRAFPELGRRIAEIIPIVGDMGSGMLEAAGQVAPLLIAMQQLKVPIPGLGGMLLFLLNPLTLAAAAIGYLALRGDQARGDMEALGSQIQTMAYSFESWSQTFLESVADVDWERLGQDIVQGVIGAFSSLGSGEGQSKTSEAISDALRNIFSGLGTVISGLARGMWDAVVRWITEPEDVETQVRRGGAALGVTIGGALTAAMFTPLRGILGRGLGGIFGGLGNLVSGLGGGRAVAGAAGRTLLRTIPGIGAILGVLFDLPQIISSFSTGGIVTGLRSVFESIINGLLMGIPRIVEQLTGTDIIQRIFDFLFQGTNIANIVASFQSGDIVRGIIESLLAVTGLGFARMFFGQLFGEDASDAVVGGITRVVRTIGGVLSQIGEAYYTIVDPVWEAWSQAFGDIRQVFDELWNDTISPLIDDIAGAFGGVTTGAQDISGAFDDAQGGIRSFGEVAATFIRDVVAPAITWLATSVIPLVVGAVQLWADSIRRLVGFWRTVWPIISPVFDVIMSGVQEIAGSFTWWWRTVTLPILTVLYSVFSSTFSAIGSVVSLWWDNITSIFEMLRWVFSGVMDAVEAVAVAAFQYIGIVVSLWWNNITSIFEMLQVVAVGAFQVIAAYISWWWESVTMPVFEFFRDLFVGVVATIEETGRDVFNFLGQFITEKIEQAALAFHILGATWEETKTVLSTGFRYIAAEVGRWLVVPFIRLQGSLVGMADMTRMAFLRLKEGVLSMIQSIMEGWVSMLSAIPGVGQRIASGLQGPLSSVRESITGIQEEQRNLQRDITRSQARRAGEIATINAGVIAAETAHAEARADWATAAQGADQARTQQRERERAAADRGERRARQRRARAAEPTEQEERRARQRPTAPAITRAVEEGRDIDPVVARGHIEAISGIHGPARQEAGRAALAEELGVSPVSEGGGTRREPRRRQARAQAQHAGRQQTREAQQQEETTALARELIISSFGPEAVRQLGEALTFNVTGSRASLRVQPECGQAT